MNALTIGVAEPTTRRDEDIHVYETTVLALDGYPLAATVFEAAASDAPLVVVNGATGVPHGFYRRFGAFLARAGFDVFTYDYRGVGASRPASLRGFEGTMADWGRLDFESVLRHARQALGRDEVHVVGHSVGGQLLGFAESQACVARVVTVGSQLGDYRHWPPPARLRMALLWHVVVPGVTHLVGHLPGAIGVGEDLPRGVALEWSTWCRTPGYFVPLHGDALRERFRRVNGPMLVYDVAADPYAPAAAVDAFQALFTEADVSRVHIEDTRLGHFGFFKESVGGAHWDDVAAFLRTPKTEA